MSNTKPAPETPDLPGDDVMYAHIEHITPLPIERAAAALADPPAQPQAEQDSAAASGDPVANVDVMCEALKLEIDSVDDGPHRIKLFAALATLRRVPALELDAKQWRQVADLAEHRAADRDRLQREVERLRACLVDKKEHQHDGK